MPANEEAIETSAPVAVSADEPQQLTLDEYCTRRSITDGRFELLGGFHFDELRAGHVKDFESAFDERLAHFANKPV